MLRENCFYKSLGDLRKTFCRTYKNMLIGLLKVVTYSKSLTDRDA